jgi:hypothetical protein
MALATPFAWAELRPDKVHVADAKKNLSYIHDGLFVGGDKAINDVVVKEIRRAANVGFERVVIDLEGTKSGEPTAIPRPPYYQVAVTPDEKRIVFTLWGKPKLGFDSRKVIAAFKKSSVVANVVLLPKVEEDTWTFVFELKGDSPVEVFELSDPVRVIMDIKGGGVPEGESPKPVAVKKHPPKKKAHARPHAKAPAHQSAPLPETAITPPDPAEETPVLEEDSADARDGAVVAPHGAPAAASPAAPHGSSDTHEAHE